jgi:hypothetical protein
MRCGQLNPMRDRRETSVRRVPRPPLTRAPGYRIGVPLLIALVGLAALAVLVLAAGVLLGLIPYPGR